MESLIYGRGLGDEPWYHYYECWVIVATMIFVGYKTLKWWLT